MKTDVNAVEQHSSYRATSGSACRPRGTTSLPAALLTGAVVRGGNECAGSPAGRGRRRAHPPPWEPTVSCAAAMNHEAPHQASSVAGREVRVPRRRDRSRGSGHGARAASLLHLRQRHRKRPPLRCVRPVRRTARHPGQVGRGLRRDRGAQRARRDARVLLSRVAVDERGERRELQHRALRYVFCAP